MQRFAKWSVRHPGEYQSIVEVLLSNRLLTPEDISNSPDVLQDPFGMQDMGTLTRRILDAIERNERAGQRTLENCRFSLALW